MYIRAVFTHTIREPQHPRKRIASAVVPTRDRGRRRRRRRRTSDASNGEQQLLRYGSSRCVASRAKPAPRGARAVRELNADRARVTWMRIIVRWENNPGWTPVVRMRRRCVRVNDACESSVGRGDAREGTKRGGGDAGGTVGRFERLSGRAGEGTRMETQD